MNFKKVVVAGGGVLGSQIAFQTAYCGFQVAVILRSEASIQRTKAKIEGLRTVYLNIIENMKKGGPYFAGITNETKLTNEQIDELKQKVEKAYKELVLTTSYEEACKDADLVIESIAEIVEQKQEFFKELIKHINPNTVVVSNSSTILPSILAPSTDRPEKFLGFHFSIRIWKMNIAEIMGHTGTDKKYYDIMEEFAKKINMVPVKIYKEQSGYILNSLLIPFLRSALDLWILEISEPKDIDITWRISTNSPLGPFEILDHIGINTIYNVMLMDPTNNQEDTTAYKICKKLKEMIDTGKLGRGTGEGFYKYK